MREGTIEAAIWRPTKTGYNILINGEEVPFPASESPLDTTRAYYPSELAALLATAIVDDGVGGVTACTCTIDPDTGYLTIETDEEIEINWVNAATTITYKFGFDTEAHPAGFVDTRVSDHPMPGYWIPGKSAEADPIDVIDVVFGTAESLSGLVRTQRFATARRKRDLTYRFLHPDLVLESENATPHATFEYIWASSLTLGRPFRVWDVTGAREYILRPGTPNPPYARNGQRAYFFDVSLLARRTDAATIDAPAPEPDGAAPSITSFTINGETTLSVRAGTLVDFAWTVNDLGDGTLTIDQGVGDVTENEGYSDIITEGSLTFTLTATNAYGSDTAQVTVTGVRQVITSYTWMRSLRGSALSGANWPYEEAGFDTITAKGSNATGGQSTTGLTALALPSALVNQAVAAATATSTGGYGDSSTSGDGNQCPTNRFHLRLIVKPGTLTNARYFCQMYRSAAEFYSLLWISSGSTLRVQTRHSGLGANRDIDFTGHGIANGSWQLIDLVFSNDEGSSGQAILRLFVNGVQVGTDEHTSGSYPGFADTQSLFGIMGIRSGSSTQDGDYLFWGIRALTNFADFSLSDHQADAEALGLYTP